MQDGLALSPEISKSTEHPLEGGIIIHGFVGNIEKPELKTLTQVIKSGVLASPSKRELDDKERLRLPDEPADYNRICFHLLTNKVANPCHYVGRAFWAASLNAVAGTIIGDDIASGSNDIFSYHNNGVEIPLNRGLLYLSIDMLDNLALLESIRQRATAEGVSAEKWIQNYIVILPRKAFENRQQLFNIVSKRIQPAKGVSADFVTKNEIDQHFQHNFVHFLENDHRFTKKDELGIGGIKIDIPLDPDLLTEFNQILGRYKNRFRSIYEDIETNPLRIEELRDAESVHDPNWPFFKMISLLNTYAPDSDIAQKAAELDKFRLELLKLNTQILEKIYPNAPSPEAIKQMSYKEKIKNGYHHQDVYVYRDTRTNYRVNLPI
jgi:hypothetical protein